MSSEHRSACKLPLRLTSGFDVPVLQLTVGSSINLAVSKMSVVSLLCRIFKPGELHKAGMWALVILCLLGFLAVSFLAFFGCKPVQASWDPTIKGAKCIESIQYVQYCYFAAGAHTLRSLSYPRLLSGVKAHTSSSTLCCSRSILCRLPGSRLPPPYM